jgi:hypothetical protein
MSTLRILDWLRREWRRVGGYCLDATAITSTATATRRQSCGLAVSLKDVEKPLSESLYLVSAKLRNDQRGLFSHFPLGHRWLSQGLTPASRVGKTGPRVVV